MNFSKNQNIFLSNAVGTEPGCSWKCKPWNAKAGRDSQSPSTATPECKGNQVLALRSLQGHSPAGKIKSGAICTTGRAQEGEF